MLGNIQFGPNHYDKQGNNVYNSANSVFYRWCCFPIISLLGHYSKVSVFKVLLDQDTHGMLAYCWWKKKLWLKQLKGMTYQKHRSRNCKSLFIEIGAAEKDDNVAYMVRFV